MPRRSTSLILLVLGTQTASADLRSFTQTYEYSTTPEGKTDLELWHTQGRRTWDKDTPQTFEQIVELEHGITDKWDLAFYSVFAQSTGDAMSAGEPFHFAQTKLETRYRLAERGEWPVDTLLYLEVGKDFGQSVYEIEGKVIGARDFDRLTVAGNAIGEVAVGNNVAESELELGFAAGATYQVTSKIKLGAETWGTYEEKELEWSAGPALSAQPAGALWLALTAGFGISDSADAFSARAIIGIAL
jgi:hypothetical protein